jgi:hypothetical protein
MSIGIHRLFQRLLAEFVCGKVVALTVRDRSGCVRMLCQIVKF